MTNMNPTAHRPLEDPRRTRQWTLGATGRTQDMNQDQDQVCVIYVICYVNLFVCIHVFLIILYTAHSPTRTLENGLGVSLLCTYVALSQLLRHCSLS